MKVFKEYGTKERLIEMMERVNKISLNEVNEVVSKKTTNVEHDPSSGTYVHNTTFVHPNKEWEIFRKKFTSILSSANQSISRIEHFLHGIELKDQEEAFMNGYKSIASDEEFKNKAVDDFYNWMGPARDDFKDDEPFYKDDEFSNEAIEFDKEEEEKEEIPAFEQPIDEPVAVGNPEDVQDDPELSQQSFDLGLPSDDMEQIAAEITGLEIPELSGDDDCLYKDNNDASQLLDPSTHWIDDYVPKNIETQEVSEVDIDNLQHPDDAEAFEDRYKEEQDFMQQSAIDNESSGLSYENGVWVVSNKGLGIAVVEQPMGSGNEVNLIVKVDSEGNIERILDKKDSWDEALSVIKNM